MNINFDNLNFNRFRDCLFLSENKQAYNPFNKKITNEYVTLIDCSESSPELLNIPEHVQSNERLFGGGQGNLYLMPHLYLQLQYNNDAYLPVGFRNLMIEQWLEVKKNMAKLLSDHQAKTGKTVHVIRTRLIIQEPAVLLGYHKHFVDNTATFCYQYKFVENVPSFIRVNHTDEETGARSPTSVDVNYPQVEKIFFSFKNDPWHCTISNSWNFNWIHDLDGEISIPEKMDDFILHESQYFNNENLKNL